MDTYSVSVDAKFLSGEMRNAKNLGDVHLADSGAALGPHSVELGSLKQSI
jgi:hypothetical protein